jgi:multiple sugar transport system permease protein
VAPPPPPGWRAPDGGASAPRHPEARTPSPAGSRWRAGRAGSRLSPSALGLLGILPALALIGALILYPVAYAAWLSLHAKHSFFPAEQFIGLRNYVEIARDEEFWDSLRRGLVYAAGTTALQLAGGVGAALVLHQAFRGRAAVRALVLFPYMIPTIVAVVVWRWLLNDTYGLVDHLLVRWGLARQPVVWLSVDWIMASLIAMSVWQFTPFVVLSVLARLQTIPLELYEAARVDGASAWSRFRHVTLPQLKAVLFVVILLRGIWMFTKFDTVWLWGEGAGAGREIRTLPIYAYMRTFTYYQAGFGSALAIVMFALLMLATLTYFGMFWREEEA